MGCFFVLFSMCSFFFGNFFFFPLVLYFISFASFRSSLSCLNEFARSLCVRRDVDRWGVYFDCIFFLQCFAFAFPYKICFSFFEIWQLCLFVRAFGILIRTRLLAPTRYDRRANRTESGVGGSIRNVKGRWCGHTDTFSLTVALSLNTIFR